MTSAKSGGGLKILFEETVEEKSTIWYHPATPIVCIITEKNQIRINNFETGRCIALFDLFAGPQQHGGELKTPKHFSCIDVVFVDKPALLWNSKSSDVAAGMDSKVKCEGQWIILLDRTTIVRWEYLTGRWAFAEVMLEGRVPATKAVLYDETSIVIGFEDGTVRLHNFLTNTPIVSIRDKHQSPITVLLTFARDLQSKPLVLSAEKEGHIFCWNMQSQSLAFKFAEISKMGKSSIAPFKKDQIRSIIYNQFYSYFLVVGPQSLSVWNSFTGFKMFSVNLNSNAQPLSFIKSLVPSTFLQHSLSRYLISSEGKLFTFDLIDGTLIEPEPQSKMVKHGKHQEINLEATLLFDLQRDLTLDQHVFSGTYMRARTATSMCILFDATDFSDHIKSHQLYFTRTPSALIKELIEPSGKIKTPIGKKYLEIIRKSETEEVAPGDKAAIAPKCVFMHVVGKHIMANMVEFYADDLGKVDYITNTSIIYTNATPYHNVKLECSYNGQLFLLLDHTVQRLQVFVINNDNLKESPDKDPAALFLHPLGAVEKIYEVPATDMVWRSDSAEFAACVNIMRQGGHVVTDLTLVNKSDIKSVINLFAIRQRDREVIPLRAFDVEDCRALFYCFGYQAHSPAGLHLFSLKSEVTTVQGEPIPSRILQSADKKIAFYVFEKKIDLVTIDASNPSNNKVYYIKNACKILTTFVWEELLFFSDQDAIWLCFPALFGRDPLKVKLASTFPTGKQQLKPANLCYILGIFDQKLVVTNSSLEVVPIELTTYYLNFYFKLKAGNNKLALDETKDLPSLEQETIVRIALYLRCFKLAALFKTFPLVYSKGFKAILAAAIQEDEDTQFEFVMLLVRLNQHASPSTKQQVLEELAKYDTKIEANQRLREVLSKIDLSSG